MSKIVVGFDGSPAGDAALAAALEEARLRSLPLEVICAYEVPALEYAGVAFAPTPEVNEAAQRHAEAVAASVAEKVGPDPGVTVTTTAVPGHPATILLHESKDATLLVVGTRGRHAFKGLVLGSVSSALAHHCAIPLLIVPAPPA